jgi:hypothetical protein
MSLVWTAINATKDTIERAVLGAGTHGDPFRPGVSVADGDDIAQGAKADAPAGTALMDATPYGAIALLKQTVNYLRGGGVGLAVKGTPFDVTAALAVTNGPYSANDVAGGLITWAGVASANGGSVIINTVILNGVVAIPYNLEFFSADIATPRADNAVFGLAAADALIHLGTVPIAAIDYTAAQTAFNSATVKPGLQVTVGAGTTSLYGYLEAPATTSPATTTIYVRIVGVRVN